MFNLHKFSHIAQTAVKASAKLFIQDFGKAKNVQIKNNDFGNLVSRADKNIELQIRKILHQHCPTHKIIGEEFSKDKVKPTDLVWIIDPIDGTTNYIQGLPFACISLGLWQGNTPLVGVVFNPITKQLWTAVKGQGAFLNKRKISASHKTSLNFTYGGFGWGRNVKKAQINFPKLLPILHKVRTLGSATLEMCLVAEGVYDFYLQNEINLWDFAASAVIVLEAGGKITEINGKPLTASTTNFLCSNQHIHKQMLSEFKKAVLI
jgi:myo-inositol-1(or 4)-monophosphatase